MGRRKKDIPGITYDKNHDPAKELLDLQDALFHLSVVMCTALELMKDFDRRLREEIRKTAKRRDVENDG